MIHHIRTVTLGTNEEQWDIEIGYEDHPVGNDSDSEVFYYKVMGPNKELFTYKIRFAESAIATTRLNLGHKDDKEKRIGIGLEKTREQIDRKQYTDLIITRTTYGWDISNAPKPLIKHSSSRGQITE